MHSVEGGEQVFDSNQVDLESLGVIGMLSHVSFHGFEEFLAELHGKVVEVELLDFGRFGFHGLNITFLRRTLHSIHEEFTGDRPGKLTRPTEDHLHISTVFLGFHVPNDLPSRGSILTYTIEHGLS